MVPSWPWRHHPRCSVAHNPALNRVVTKHAGLDLPLQRLPRIASQLLLRALQQQLLSNSYAGANSASTSLVCIVTG